jgi:hypothetical protein
MESHAASSAITGPQAAPEPAESGRGSTDVRLTIGALAKICGITVRTLRYYEELDLIRAETRTEGGYRLYSAETRQRVMTITALQDLHFSLDAIGALLGKASERGNIETRHQRITFTCVKKWPCWRILKRVLPIA